MTTKSTFTAKMTRGRRIKGRGSAGSGCSAPHGLRAKDRGPHLPLDGGRAAPQHHLPSRRAAQSSGGASFVVPCRRHGYHSHHWTFPV